MNDAQPFSLRLIMLGSGLFLSVLVWLSVAVPPAAPIPPARAPLMPPAGLTAEAYVVQLAGDAPPLMAQRSHKRMAPASLTKIMTAFIAREVLASDDTVLFSPDAKAAEEHRSDAAAGEVFLRDGAVRIALLASANDAALALAEAAGAKAGKIGFNERIAFFVRLMNERAAALMMLDTHFENPVGLDAPDHTMSAADLARMAEEVLMRDPVLFAQTTETNAEVFSLEQKKHTIENTNDLLKKFPALAGGKTGFTDAAQGTLLLLYPVRAAGARKIAVIVLLKSEDRFGDGEKIIQFLEQNFP